MDGAHASLMASSQHYVFQNEYKKESVRDFSAFCSFYNSSTECNPRTERRLQWDFKFISTFVTK